MGQRDGLGNQQESAVADLQWLGGIFDGEGSFSIVFNQRTETATSMIRLTNSSDVMIAEVARILREHEMPFHLQRRAPQGGGTRDIWHLSINGAKRSRRVLPLLMPYLRAKRAEAEIVWRWVESRLNKAPGSPYTTEEIDWFAELRMLHGYRLARSSETIRQALAKARG
jgi:hypothetical protein